MSTSPPAQILVGPLHHGVTEYARETAEAVARLQTGGDVHHVDSADAAEALIHRYGRVHLHVTDGLYGATLEEATARVVRLLGAGRVTVTLHDVPQASDGERNVARRSTAYRAIADAAAGVVVNSHHEELLVHEHLGADVRVAVIPLGTRHPLSPPTPKIPPTPGALEVLLAGYVYPGKGHDDAIEAAALVSARTGASASVTALGGISPGHEVEADRFAARATELGVDFTVTGYLEPAEYRARCVTAGIPLVAHRHYSASRSLLDWAEQGRRPIVVDTRYTREMASLRPGTLHLTALDDLADAIQARHQDPASTFLHPGHPIGPTLDDAAASYLTWWESIAW